MSLPPLHRQRKKIKYNLASTSIGTSSVSSKPIDLGISILDGLSKFAKETYFGMHFTRLVELEEKKNDIMGKILDHSVETLKNPPEFANLDWQFSIQLQLEYLVSIYARTIFGLKGITEQLEKKESLVAFLDKEKKSLQDDFQKFCSEGTNDKNFADEFLKVFCHTIFKTLKVDYSKEITMNLLKIQKLSSKKKMMFEMQNGLLDQPASELMHFSTNFEEFAKKWIKSVVLRETEEKGWFKGQLKDSLSNTLKKMEKVCEETLTSALEENCRPEDWLEMMKKKTEENEFIFKVSFNKTRNVAGYTGGGIYLNTSNFFCHSLLNWNTYCTVYFATNKSVSP